MKKKKNTGILGKLFFKLSFFGVIFLLFVLSILVIGILDAVSGNNTENLDGYDYNASGGFQDAVEAYRHLITKLCEEYNTQPDKLKLPDYVNAMLALIQVDIN